MMGYQPSFQHKLFVTGFNLAKRIRKDHILRKIVEAIMRDPFQGIGKPEPLKLLGSGVWSRPITQEHRIVYVVDHERVDGVQARHYY